MSKNMTSKSSEADMNLKHTPRPVPKFYDDRPMFSTKKALMRRRGYREENLLGSCGPNRTAPPLSRVYARRYSNQPAQFISFRRPRSLFGVWRMTSGSQTTTQQMSHDKTRGETFLDQAFIIESKLGQGSFGEVFKVRSKADVGEAYAVKRSIEEFRGQLDRQAKLREVEKHESLPDHPNLLKFICAWEEAGLLYIQTELCYMSLASLSDLNHSIPESFVWQFMIDLLEALKYLHEHSLIHMDIKPANIFITDQQICKLGDFGLIYDLKDPDPSPQEGDAKYLAPELLHSSRPTTSADMFSLGITLLEVACDLSLPVQDEPWQALRQGSLPWDIMKHKMTPFLGEIITNLLHSDPTKRHSATQLLHRLESAEKEKLEERRIAVHARTISNGMSGFWSWMCSLVTYLIVLFLYPLYHVRSFKRGRHNWNWETVPTVNPTEDGNFGDVSSNRKPLNPPLFKVPLAVDFLDTSSSSSEDDNGKQDEMSGSTSTTDDHDDSTEPTAVKNDLTTDSNLILSPPIKLPKKLPLRPFNSTPRANNNNRKRAARLAGDPAYYPLRVSHGGGDIRSQSSWSTARGRPSNGDGDGNLKKGTHQPPSVLPLLHPSSPQLLSAASAALGNPPPKTSQSAKIVTAATSARHPPVAATSSKPKPFQHVSPRKLKFAFDHHGSSSEDEYSY